MYKIIWDEATGGVLLINEITPKILGTTPRPVFWEELDLLKLKIEYGWDYPNTEEPLLWAINKQYYYKGQLVFETKGANIYDSAKLVFMPGSERMILEPVNVKSMLEKNKDFMFLLESEAMEFIHDTWLMYSGANKSAERSVANQLDYELLAAYQEKQAKTKMAIVKEDCDSFDIMPFEQAQKLGKRIYHGTKIDCFIASFSGGKDSQVVLDLCTRALPPSTFEVIYSDTGYELPPSLTMYAEIEDYYKKLYPTLKFSIARNHKSVLNYWDQIGTPSDTHRWCCAIMKTAPLYRMLKIEGSNMQAKVLTFDGVRAEESTRRARYERIGKGVKHNTVINASPILNWNTIEIFFYLFKYNLPINPAYRQGMTRVGCVLCPFSSEWNDMVSYHKYADKVRPFLNRIEKVVEEAGIQDPNIYIKEGNWKRRAGGRDIKFPSAMDIVSTKPHLKIEISNSQKNIMTYFRAITDYSLNGNIGEFKFKNVVYTFTIENKNNNVVITFENTHSVPILQGIIKRAISKATYCIDCEACEVECPTGALNILSEQKIDPAKCIHCQKCLQFHEHGCIVASSVHITDINNSKNKMKLTGYNNFGLNSEWLETYLYSYKTYFADNLHGLNIKEQLPPFTKWLFQAGMINDVKNKQITNFGRFIADLYQNMPDIAWQIIWINLSYNAPIAKWFNEHIDWNFTFSMPDIEELVHNDYPETSKTTIRNIVYALFRTFRESPIGELGIATQIDKITYKKNAILEVSREAIAYSLYKFGEANEIKNFRVADLYSKEVKQGVFKEFGVSRFELENVLRSLNSDKNHVLVAELNMGLDHIRLREDLDALKALQLLVD